MLVALSVFIDSANDLFFSALRRCSSFDGGRIDSFRRVYHQELK
jgi:hypothetical protein